MEQMLSGSNVSQRWVTDDEPSRRYPVYTRGNVGEVFPDVVSPLTWSLLGHEADEGWKDAFMAAGALVAADFEPDRPSIVASFGGYAFLNVDYNRLFAFRTPLMSVADVDRSLFGAVSTQPFAGGTRRVGASLRALRTLIATLSTRALPEVDDDAAEVDRWRAGLALSDTDDAALLAGLKSFRPLFRRLFSRHIQVSFKAGVSGSVLHQLCEKFLNDPSLATVLVSGLGGVESAGPSVALWRLARIDPHGTGFVEQFDRFLADFGYRGPNEWDLGAPTWDINPGGALAAIDSLRRADDAHDPDVQRVRLAAESANALATSLARLPRRVRGRFKKAVRSAQVCARARERTKSTAIRAIHGARLIVRELGRRAETRGASDSALVLLVTAEELSDYLADPAAWNDRLGARRQRREELARLEPPFVLTPDRMSTTTWPTRSDTAVRVTAGEVLSGIGACPGVARGRARVVLDPYDPRGLGPGDVLVAPITDPSWTPLFLSAEAVVVDVGAVMSHAVIVSRELGIPAVVSVTDATRRIPDGALIEVDGTNGRVTVLAELPT